jgi:hypothetical protein
MEKWLILAMFMQVVLTSLIMIVMGRRRFAAAKQRQFPLSAFRTMDLAGANESVITAARSFDNQFQMPILFYVVSILLVVMNGQRQLSEQAPLLDGIFVGLAWVFVALRLLHAVIHLTSNHVRARFNSFLISCIVLWIMWLRFIWMMFLS